MVQGRNKLPILASLGYDVNNMPANHLIFWFAAIIPAAQAEQKATTLPDIGLRIAMPTHMAPLPITSLTDWLRVGVKGEGETYDQILVLSALPAGPRRDAKSAATMWVSQAQRGRDAYHVLRQRAAEWLDGGWEVLATYQAGDRIVTSLQWFGWRNGPTEMVYVLTYDAAGGRGDGMRAVMSRVATSCKLLPIKPACTQPVTLGKRQVLPKLGVSLELPTVVRPMVPNRENMVLRAGAVDYTRDRLLPVVTLTTNELRSGDTPKARLMRTVDELMPSLRPKDGKLTSQAPARIGSRDAYEVRLDMTQRRERLRMGIRLTTWRDRALVLSVIYPVANAEQLEEAIEKIAASFVFEQ